MRLQGGTNPAGRMEVCQQPSVRSRLDGIKHTCGSVTTGSQEKRETLQSLKGPFDSLSQSFVKMGERLRVRVPSDEEAGQKGSSRVIDRSEKGDFQSLLLFQAEGAGLLHGGHQLLVEHGEGRIRREVQPIEAGVSPEEEQKSHQRLD